MTRRKDSYPKSVMANLGANGAAARHSILAVTVTPESIELIAAIVAHALQGWIDPRLSRGLHSKSMPPFKFSNRNS